MQRIREPSYQEKLDTMNNSKLRKYNDKQKQRELYQQEK